MENLFGVKKVSETELAGKKRKASKKNFTIGDDDEDDIALIWSCLSGTSHMYETD